MGILEPGRYRVAEVTIPGTFVGVTTRADDSRAASGVGAGVPA